jgi:hypothetical protein
VNGRNFVDFGSGFGWMMAAAIALGALRGVGYELPANAPQRRIYRAVIKVVQQQNVGFATEVQQQDDLNLLDINEVFAVSNFSSHHGFTLTLCCFVSSS